MKGAVLALGAVGAREAAALVVDGRLEEIWIDGPEPFAGARPGSIHRARVARPAKGQGGVFVDLAGGTGFLRAAKGLAPGDALLVQVSGVAEPGKAPPVTPRLLFKGRHAIVTPGAPGLNVSRAIKDEAVRERLELLLREADAPRPEGAGVILRSVCAEAPEDEIVADLAAMGELAFKVLADPGQGPELLVEGDGAHEAALRERPEGAAVEEGADAFASLGVLEMLDDLRRPEVPLPGGGRLFVEATRALTAVDVDTGGDLAPAAGLRAALAAAREVPRQLRLRGLGGQVVIDMPPIPKRERRQVEAALAAALRRAGEGSVVGWTGLGHLELTLKRERPPVAPLLEDLG